MRFLKFLRFVLATAIAAGVTYFYARWARDESEAQLGRMQINAYNTPGAEAPVPPQVAATGFSVLGGTWWALRKVLRLRGATTVFAMLAGVVMGLAVLIATSTDTHSQ